MSPRRLRPLALRSLRAGNRPGPGNRRPRQATYRTILGGLGLVLIIALTGCTIPAELVPSVIDGAVAHASQHVAAGNAAEPVLCAVPDPDHPGGQGLGVLIPSRLVAVLGCHLADRAATSTACRDTGLTGPLAAAPWNGWWMCADIGFDEGPPPILQEDEPGWDCRFDGNRRCGPLTPAGVDAPGVMAP